MAEEVGIREFKNGASRYIERVESGEVITVTRHGTPVARLIPAGISSAIAQLIADGLLTWSGGKPELPSDRIRLRGEGPTTADYVREGRR